MIFWFNRLIDDVAISLRIVLSAEIMISSRFLIVKNLPSDFGTVSLISCTRLCFCLLVTSCLFLSYSSSHSLLSVSVPNRSCFKNYLSLSKPVKVTLSVLSVFVCDLSSFINLSIILISLWLWLYTKWKSFFLLFLQWIE